MNHWSSASSGANNNTFLKEGKEATIFHKHLHPRITVHRINLKYDNATDEALKTSSTYYDDFTWQINLRDPIKAGARLAVHWIGVDTGATGTANLCTFYIPSHRSYDSYSNDEINGDIIGCEALSTNSLFRFENNAVGDMNEHGTVLIGGAPSSFPFTLRVLQNTSSKIGIDLMRVFITIVEPQYEA